MSVVVQRIITYVRLAIISWSEQTYAQ